MSERITPKTIWLCEEATYTWRRQQKNAGDIEYTCAVHGVLSAVEIESRLNAYDDLLAACIDTESWLQDYVQNARVVDGRAFDIGKKLAAAIVEKE